MAQTCIITGQNVRIQQTAATVLQRVVAWVIDYIVLMIIMFVFTALFLSLMSTISISFGSRVGEDIEQFFTVIFFLGILMYPFWMELFNNGQSLGKMAMRIRVVCLDGTRPSISAFFIRWITLIIDGALGLAFIIFSKNSQRIGDLAAGTTVVKVSKADQPAIFNALYFISKNFQPTFPEASKLTMHQIGIIEKVLDMEFGEERSSYIDQLTEKITKMLGIMPKDNNKEHFLITLYNDFQFYATKVV